MEGGFQSVILWSSIIAKNYDYHWKINSPSTYVLYFQNDSIHMFMELISKKVSLMLENNVFAHYFNNRKDTKRKDSGAVS